MTDTAEERVKNAWRAYDNLHAAWPDYRDSGRRDEWFKRVEDQRTRIEAAILEGAARD